MDKLSGIHIAITFFRVMYMECDNTDPLESDSDSNGELSPFVDLS